MAPPRAREAVSHGLARAGSPVGVLAPGIAESGNTPDVVVGRARMWEKAGCGLRGRPESVKLARAFAREILTGWGLPGLCDDVTWVISELVTNALSHGLARSALARWARPIQLCLTIQLAHVVCTVSDPGAGAPVSRDPDYWRECGRGLQVVESCSDRWGWNALDGGGKVIWAAFRVRG